VMDFVMDFVRDVRLRYGNGSRVTHAGYLRIATSRQGS
jgi:hypothetical protein